MKNYQKILILFVILVATAYIIIIILSRIYPRAPFTPTNSFPWVQAPGQKTENTIDGSDTSLPGRNLPKKLNFFE